jgi:hypothetical protein
VRFCFAGLRLVRNDGLQEEGVQKEEEKECEITELKMNVFIHVDDFLWL